MGLSNLFARWRKTDSEGDVGADAPTFPSKALARFLNNLGARSSPHLLDLGPVVGSNVTFFGEQLGCKITFEDISKDLDQHIREQRVGELPKLFETRFSQRSGSLDGILCWDLFDYLDKASAQSLARRLTHLLRPDGVLLAMFTTASPQPGARPTYTRYVVVNPMTLQHRVYPAARGKQRPLLNRDIQRMFEPLRVTEQFLLKTNMREVLLRKPAEVA